MCGRYVLTTPSEEMRRAFGFAEHPNLAPRYNIAPTQEAPVVRQRRAPAGERTLQNLRWGLVPAWAADPRIGARLINARAETLREKPAFRTAFRRRRCLVPADGFYEWQAEGRARQPFLITQRDGAVFAFAGVWERWTPSDGAAPFDSFTIITTTANDFLKPLHERMPVILPPDAYARWLDPGADPDGLVELLKPAANDVLRCTPVDARVNSPRHDDAELLAPIGPERRWA